CSLVVARTAYTFLLPSYSSSTFAPISVLNDSSPRRTRCRSGAKHSPRIYFSDPRSATHATWKFASTGAPLHPSWQRSHPSLPADRRDVGTPALALLHHRWRRRRLR